MFFGDTFLYKQTHLCHLYWICIWIFNVVEINKKTCVRTFACNLALLSKVLELVELPQIRTDKPWFVVGPLSQAAETRIHKQINVFQERPLQRQNRVSFNVHTPCLCNADQQRFTWHEQVEDCGFGYGSIPIDTIFSGMNIHKSQLFWGSLGTRVLTHPHLIKMTWTCHELCRWRQVRIAPAVSICE